MTHRVQRYQPVVYADADMDMEPHPDGEWVRFDEIPSWLMLMDILDAVYPASVFTGASGDTGPAIIVKLREIDALRNQLSTENTK